MSTTFAKPSPNTSMLGAAGARPGSPGRHLAGDHADLVAPRGVGGTIKEHTIEIQGDKRETMVARLQRLGYKNKLVGGRSPGE